MGQQQLLLIILSIIILGISISIGITLFNSNSDSANKDQIAAQLNFAASNGYTFYLKSKHLVGAGNDIDNLLKQESIDIWLPEILQITGEPEVKKTNNGFSISVISANGKDKATIVENLSDNSRTISWEKL